jgi:hypothetical protein
MGIIPTSTLEYAHRNSIEFFSYLPVLLLRPMKLNSRSRCLSVALGLTAGCAVLAAPAIAQTADTQANPLADFQTQNNDPFSGQSDATHSMMNLMQRVMQGDRPDAATFAATQKENMNDAMANFRAKQMQLIKARQMKAQAGSAIALPGTVSPSVQPAIQPAAPIQTLLLPAK